MTKSPVESLAQRKFDSARKRLAESLLELERSTKRKISQQVVESKMMANEGDSSLETRFSELQIIHKNLEEEVKTLQKNFAEIGKENLFLHEKNKFLADRIKNFQEHGSRIIESVEQNLSQIEEIINKHDN